MSIEETQTRSRLRTPNNPTTTGFRISHERALGGSMKRTGPWWDPLVMDGALTRAPLGGEKIPDPLPPTDAESGVKGSRLSEGQGVPIGLVAEGARRHDITLVRATVMRLVIARPEPTAERPQGRDLEAGGDDDESLPF
jgi:hypothetical protein